ncbi:MAG: cytochrome c biogenesis CcdA family protein [Pseudobdellovibrio sp.]
MEIQLGLSFLAGLLTTLSPCVLPILPMLMGSAVQKNKKAPLMMIIGLAAAFVVVGFLLSRVGSLFGFDGDQIRTGSAIFLIIFSFFFFSKTIQDFVSMKMSSFASIGSSRSQLFKEDSNLGALAIGALLGVIWSPCVGPTLGIAISFASQDGKALQALLTMLVYAIGAAIPMLGVAYGLQSLFLKHRGKILNFAEYSKKFFGIVLLFSGIIILTGTDKKIEAYLLEKLPVAWVSLITKY